MGCDIHGFVECKWGADPKDSKSGFWTTIVNVGHYVGRNYDAFGCLFGVRNDANFMPIAPGRGLPEDATYETKDEVEKWNGDAHSTSYITLEEINRINLDEPAEMVDARPHEYYFKGRGKVYEGKAAWSSELAENGVYEILEENPDASVNIIREDGSTLAVGNEVMTRRDALKPDFIRLFALMNYLAKEYGEQFVRLVVWFDN